MKIWNPTPNFHAKIRFLLIPHILIAKKHPPTPFPLEFSRVVTIHITKNKPMCKPTASSLLSHT